MPVKERLTTSLEPECVAFIEESVSSGLYSSKSATINAAVKLLKKSTAAKEAKSEAAQIKRILKQSKPRS